MKRRRTTRKKKSFQENALEILGAIGREIPFPAKAALVAILVLVFLSGFYAKVIRGRTWMNHTSINGIDVSGKTMDQTLDLLPDGSDYSLLIRGRDNGEFKITDTNIDYKITFDRNKLKKLFKKQHTIIRFPWTSRKYKVAGNCSFDEEKLKEILDQCLLIKGSDYYTVTEPADADVFYSEKEGKPVIKEEVYGNTLKKKAFRQAVEDALKEGAKEINLDDKKTYPDIYKTPKVTADSKEIQEGVKAYNAYINRFITWDMWEGESYTLKPAQIRTLAYYKDGQMHCRIYKLEKLIHKFCDKYTTAGKTRHFVTHKGKKIKVTKGDYGWMLDYAKTLDQAETTLAAALDEKAVNKYLKAPTETNREKITTHLEPQYKSKAFSIDYDKYQDWDPDNYTEVSISEQMVYVHRKGKIAFKCKTISGLPVPGRETGKGVYYVKGRSKDRVLTGDDYETPVKYWIRLTTTGTGFHAAPWQKWKKWSKTYYKKHGSHGCLNLSDKDAGKMYKILEKGEAVFIY